MFLSINFFCILFWITSFLIKGARYPRVWTSLLVNIRWSGVICIYYPEILRASEGMLLVPAALAVVNTHSSFKEGWRQAGGRS
jgi:hypothetical protein